MAQSGTLKGIDELLDVSSGEVPKRKWVCGVCGRVNDAWVITVASIVRGDPEPQYRQGECSYCAVENAALDAQSKIDRDREGRLKVIRKLHSRAGLPKELAHVKFAGLERRRGAEEAFAEMEELDVEQDRTWMCLMGTNNTGKSRLLAATSNRQNGMLIPTLYVNETLFFKTVKESWDEEGEAKVMSVFKMAELVLWDEFAFYDFTDRSWIYERVYAILEQLAEADKKVVFATNIMNPRKKKEGDQFSIEGRCGKRIWARLQRRNTRYIEMKNEPFF